MLHILPRLRGVWEAPEAIDLYQDSILGRLRREILSETGYAR